MTTMRISQLADRTGVPATTLRFYETAGLLPAGRTGAGYRVYGEDAVRRLAFIGSAKHLGLALEDIAELLAVWESEACSTVKADLRPRLVSRLAAAEARAADLAEFTATLRGTLRHLDALPDRDEPCGPHCEYEADPDDQEPPAIACSLTDGEMRERLADWRQVLAGADRGRVPGGVRLTVPSGRAAALAALVIAEQRCCPFLGFRLEFAGADVRLEVSAPSGASDLLEEMFPSSL